MRKENRSYIKAILTAGLALTTAGCHLTREETSENYGGLIGFPVYVQQEVNKRLHEKESKLETEKIDR